MIDLRWRSDDCLEVEVKVLTGGTIRLENRRVSVYPMSDGDIMICTKALKKDRTIYKTETRWSREGVMALLYLLDKMLFGPIPEPGDTEE